MKINLIYLISGIFFGCLLYSRYGPEKKSEPKIVYVEKYVEKSGTIKRKIKVNNDGSKDIDEIEVFLSKKSSIIKKEHKKENNLFFILDKKSLDTLYKYDNILIGIGFDIENKELLYKLGYSTRIF